MALTLPYSPEDIATLWPYLTLAEQREMASLVNELPIPDLTLKEFVQEAWLLVEPTSPFIPGWHIDVICDHLQAVSFARFPTSSSTFRSPYEIPTHQCVLVLWGMDI